MTQNTSHAVMQQRHEAHDSLDDFPTPPWATRGLIEHVIWPRMHWKGALAEQTVWEPACNRGYMAKPLAEYFGQVWASDIHDYGWGGQQFTQDFLFGWEPAEQPPNWIITNPPFRLGAQFIARALTLTPNVAMIVRTSFLEGADRYRNLFSKTPPSVVAQFVERVPMVKGRHDPEASTATSYAWLVWLERAKETHFQWIPPCRREFQRKSDSAEEGNRVA